MNVNSNDDDVVADWKANGLSFVATRIRKRYMCQAYLLWRSNICPDIENSRYGGAAVLPGQRE